MSPAANVDALPTGPRSCGHGALDALFSRVYHELRDLAHRRVRQSRPGETLGTTALVHEAYVKLAGGSDVVFRGRDHFFRLVARVMRQIVVDHARRRSAARRGGCAPDLSLTAGTAAPVASHARADEVLALDAAIDRLAELDARAVRVIELRFFAGLSVRETAAALDVSAVTVKRDTRLARAFLSRELLRQAG